jgi:hypothetical protein
LTIRPQPRDFTYAVSLLSSELPQFIDARDHKNAWRDPCVPQFAMSDSAHSAFWFWPTDFAFAQRLVFVN